MEVSEMGRRGGLARAAKMTAAERRESALKAINARWAAHRAAQKLDTKKAKARSSKVKSAAKKK